jgi:RNA polymerase sigma-70 factor (ECF subfamily)
VTDGESLECLMTRYLGGDLGAFDALYARVSPRVFSFLLGMTHDRARAEDLCQVTFIKMHQGRAGWIQGAQVMPWVMAIARNALADDVRRIRRAHVVLTPTGELPESRNHDRDIDELLDSAEVGGEPMVPALQEAIAALSPSYKEALVLTKHTGLSLRDAAIVLGTTETAVKLRVHRAYIALRRAFGKGEKKEKKGPR